MGALEQIRDEYLHHLDGMGGIKSYQLDPASTQSQLAFDAVLRIQTEAGEHELVAVEYKSHLTHGTVDRLVHQGGPDRSRLLILAPHIGALLGAKLAGAGISYLDRQGNCHIATGLLHIHVEGRTAPSQPAIDKAIRSAGYQVLFAFLAKPSLLDRTLRDVANECAASRQAVSDMKKRLLESEYVVETKSGVRWINRRRDDALSLWLGGYESTVRPSLMWGNYRVADSTPAELEKRIESTFARVGIDELRWGGSAAGFRLTGHFRGERTVVHVHATPGDIRNQLRALSDPRGNLILMNAFGTINWEREATVHPLLVYSEMLAEGNERAREAAREVFERHVQPIWEEVA
jgi:hypothetical protein